jgi:hypothetical protein
MVGSVASGTPCTSAVGDTPAKDVTANSSKISGFSREVDEKCVMGYYAASRGNFLPKFPSSRVKNPRIIFGFLTPEDGTDRLSRNVGKNYHYSLCNNPEERSSQTTANITP